VRVQRRPRRSADGAPAGAPSAASIAAAAAYRGRINMMRTDMPYCSVYGGDPPLRRHHVAVLWAPRAGPHERPLPAYGAVKDAVKKGVRLGMEGVKLEPLWSGDSWAAMAAIVAYQCATRADVVVRRSFEQLYNCLRHALQSASAGLPSAFAA
jgi:hypothetical protein